MKTAPVAQVKKNDLAENVTNLVIEVAVPAAALTPRRGPLSRSRSQLGCISKAARAKESEFVMLPAAWALGSSCLAVVARQTIHHPKNSPTCQRNASWVVFMQQVDQAYEPVDVDQIGCVQLNLHGFCKKRDWKQRIECIVLALARKQNGLAVLKRMSLLNAQPAYPKVLGNQI